MTLRRTAPVPLLTLSLTLLSLSALLGSCAPLPTLSAAPESAAAFPELPRAPGSPDVVLFGVSGRCGLPCQAPQDNWDYLAERGTLSRLAEVFEARGLRVEIHSYAERIAGQFQSRRSDRPQRGILELLSDYARLTSAWTVGRPSGTRVVLVGHSHGAVWTHYLSARFPQVPVAAMIDLDSSCVAWGADHGAEARAALRASALPPVPGPALNLWSADPLLSPLRACGSLLSRNSGSLKDLALPNVALNLEVQSKRWPARPETIGRGRGLAINYLFDLTRNTRQDGSREGVSTFVSAREDHSAVSYPHSAALGWVTRQLELLPWLPPRP